MVTSYFVHFRGIRNHFFLIPKDRLQERMKQISSELAELERLHQIKIQTATRIDIEAYADVTELEIRYAFRHHPDFLRQLGLFPLHDSMPHLDIENVMYFLELQYDGCRPFLQIFNHENLDDHARENALSMRVERKDKGIPQIHFDRSLKVRYKGYEILDRKKTNQLFGSYFHPPIHGL